MAEAREENKNGAALMTTPFHDHILWFLPQVGFQ